MWPSQITLDTDVLSGQKNALLGLGFLALDLFGTTTTAAGLACTQTAIPGMSVLVAPGRLYSLQNVDNTSYGSLPLDTSHQIVKQGILLNTATLAITAPTTAGQSINYLIEATYSDVDTNLTVLPYYNSANPTQTYSGPNNNGVPQATVRQGQVVLVAKAGTAAATGTQTTPAPDSGYMGLWVVTVAYGATSVVNANISQYSGAAFQVPIVSLSGSFTVTATGFSGTAPSGTAYYRSVGALVELILPALSGTSNATTFTLTGIPSALQPANAFGNQISPIPLAQNNSAYVAGAYASISASSGTISLGLLGTLGGWTASGTKSVSGSLRYSL